MFYSDITFHSEHLKVYEELDATEVEASLQALGSKQWQDI